MLVENVQDLISVANRKKHSFYFLYVRFWYMARSQAPQHMTGCSHQEPAAPQLFITLSQCEYRWTSKEEMWKLSQHSLINKVLLQNRDSKVAKGSNDSAYPPITTQNGCLHQHNNTQRENNDFFASIGISVHQGHYVFYGTKPSN